MNSLDGHGTFKRGEISKVPEDANVYEALISFWLAPFAHLHPGDTFLWSPSTEHIYYMPCGYDPSGDVEALASKEGFDKNIGSFYKFKRGRTG